LYRESWSR